MGCAGAPKRESLPAPVQRAPNHGAAGLLGSWKAKAEPGYFVQFEEDRYTVAFRGQVRSVARILAFEGLRARLCDRGRERTLETAFQGDDLLVTDPESKVVRRLERVPTPPAELILEPLRLPRAEPVSAEEVAQIQRQLGERLRADEEAQQSLFGGIERIDPEAWRRPAPPPEASWSQDNLRWIETTSRNTEYLKKLVTSIGWIDVSRFGYATAKAAILIVQHSRDLPLMLAALPESQRDADAGRIEGEGYALLYDRLQLSLGRRQRFGTQIGRDEGGAPVVLPIEETAGLDDLRNHMGLAPLGQYLKLFGTEEVRFSTACQATQ